MAEHFGVYMYPYNQQVSLGNFNMPTNNKTIVLHRGANTPLSFTVHNADGKYTILKDNEYLVFSIYDARNDTKIYDVVLEKQQASWISESGMARPSIGNKIKVYYGCMIPAGIIENISLGGKYRWSIRKVTVDGSLNEPVQYLYTGLAFETSGELTIDSTAVPVFVPSIEISKEKNMSFLSAKDWWRKPIAHGVVGEFGVLNSTPVRAEAQYGLLDGLSTISFYFNNFIGRVQLQGSLSNDVPKDAEDYKWFIIDINPCCTQDYIQSEIDKDGNPIPINGIKSFNFKGNFMWLRVVTLIPPKIITYPPNITKKEYDPYETMPKILIRR